MNQLTKNGFSGTGSEVEREALRIEFERSHCVLLRQFVHPTLAVRVLAILERATFAPAHYEDIGSELKMDRNLAHETLSFLANDPKFFSLVEHITGCRSIGCFAGRIYRLVPSPEHHFSWHNDLESDGRRLAALSINLSAKPFDGGILQIRDSNSERIVSEVHNTGVGDAVLFKISREVEHRLTAIHGDNPKTSFVGWFASQPEPTAFWGQSILAATRSSID